MTSEKEKFYVVALEAFTVETLGAREFVERFAEEAPLSGGVGKLYQYDESAGAIVNMRTGREVEKVADGSAALSVLVRYAFDDAQREEVEVFASAEQARDYLDQMAENFRCDAREGDAQKCEELRTRLK